MEQPTQPPQAPQPPVVVVDDPADVEKHKLLAAISYIWIIGVIMLLVKKDSPFVQFHAKQATVLFIASIVLSIIPLLGWMLNIVVFVFAVIGFIGALQGKRTELPLVKEVASKLNF